MKRSQLYMKTILTEKEANDLLYFLQNHPSEDFTPDDVFDLVSWFDLFKAPIEGRDPWEAPTPFIAALWNLVIAEIAPNFSNHPPIPHYVHGINVNVNFTEQIPLSVLNNSDNSPFLKIKSLFVRLLNKDEAALFALQNFSTLAKAGILKDEVIDTLIKNINWGNFTSVYFTLRELEREKMLTDTMFMFVMNCPANANLGGSFGRALADLNKVGLLEECQEYLLKNLEEASTIALRIKIVCKLHTWPSTKVQLKNSPDKASEILRNLIHELSEQHGNNFSNFLKFLEDKPVYVDSKADTFFELQRVKEENKKLLAENISLKAELKKISKPLETNNNTGNINNSSYDIQSPRLFTNNVNNILGFNRLSNTQEPASNINTSTQLLTRSNSLT